jgi:mannose-6-phosphate isomerase-like protein (cupin superfamily)
MPINSSLKASASALLESLPGKVSPKWPTGERFINALAHGSMSVELYAPVEVDPQVPHEQDELYFVHSGHGELVIGGERHAFTPGAAFFIPAGLDHRFENFSPGFCTWVVFWGPPGGERAA